jgi:hypothetical protein
VHIVGSHEWLLDHYGFAPESIARTVIQTLEKKK